jgi:hypothetical protein
VHDLRRALAEGGKAAVTGFTSVARLLRARAEITRPLRASWRPRWCSSTRHASHAG